MNNKICARCLFVACIIFLSNLLYLLFIQANKRKIMSVLPAAPKAAVMSYLLSFNYE